MNLLEDQFLLFEIDEEKEEFREIKVNDNPIHTLLDSASIFIIVDPIDKAIWVWEGQKAGIRKKFIATQNAPNIRDKHGIDFKIIAVDEGEEPSNFKEIVGLE
ncbi:MAG: hypothetical protein ACFE8G_13545 [Candidatus Hermodarchaeota archaeon]